jgi:hypothetical protein
MSIERRCTCESDFVEFVIENQSGYNPLKYKSKNDFAHELWKRILRSESMFYNKHGYLDVIFNAESNSFSRKKTVGRPSSVQCKKNRITIRLDDDQIARLEEYCDRNNIKDKAEAIRIAINKLVD